MTVSKYIGVINLAKDVESSRLISQIANYIAVNCDIREGGFKFRVGPKGDPGSSADHFHFIWGRGGVKIISAVPKPETDLVHPLSYSGLSTVFDNWREMSIYYAAILVNNIFSSEIIDRDKGAKLLYLGIPTYTQRAEPDDHQEDRAKSNVRIWISQASRKYLSIIPFAISAIAMFTSGEWASRSRNSRRFLVALAVWIACVPVILFAWSLVIP